MDDVALRRKVEYLKYDRAYKQKHYRMGQNRKAAAFEVLKGLNIKGSLLDVAAGRGEMVEYAQSIGYDAKGVDIVDYLLTGSVVYGESSNLPFEDNSFDVVTSFDAFEHFLPEDTEISLQEINRVSKRAVILCIALTPSMYMEDELHINLRSTDEWDELINKFIAGKAERLPNSYKTRSATWVITKEERT